MVYQYGASIEHKTIFLTVMAVVLGLGIPEPGKEYAVMSRKQSTRGPPV
jgi:hypothetical protein